MADWHKASIVAGPTASSSSTTNKATSSCDDLQLLQFQSRRSPVLCRNGCVASSQPLASQIGLDILKHRGGNAADAAVAVAAVLAVVEPCSTGLGGDMFCLYYDAKTKQVSAINGSGRSPSKLSYGYLRDKYPAAAGDGIDFNAYCFSADAVTVPGAARGWEDLCNRHGSGNLTFKQLLEPAAKLASDGFVVSTITSYMWNSGLHQITKWIGDDSCDEHNIPLVMVDKGDGSRRRGPKPGEIIINEDMARVLRDLGSMGATDGFYNGRAGRAIVDAVQFHGGCLSIDDLLSHKASEFPIPISATYRNHKLWQVPPNGQGIAGLIALQGLDYLERHGILREKPFDRKSIGTDEYYHALIEMMRLGFADARSHVTDPNFMKIGCDNLLDPERIGSRAVKLFDASRATIHGVPDPSSCTVSFQVVDSQGNAASFVNSNYMGFGTGIVPRGCGFTMQNRGAGFTLDKGPDHPNSPAPSKRPCHTIIPALITHADTNELYATISNMGGNMQPQGHLQLTVNMLAGQHNPQEAIDHPRFCIVDGTHNGTVFVEDGISADALKNLKNRGHVMSPNVCEGYGRSIFGRAQIIKRDRETGVLWGGSDGRADGCAIGY